MRVPKRKGEELARAAKVQDHLVSKEKLAQMKRTLTRLENERPAAAEEVARTAAMGDLSENAGYTAAKARLRSINNRILSLQEQIKYAVIIEQGSRDGKINVGSTVRLDMNGEEKTFEILGSKEANPMKGKISHSSPLGALLIGHEAGETLELETASGTAVYRILEVK